MHAFWQESHRKRATWEHAEIVSYFAVIIQVLQPPHSHVSDVAAAKQDFAWWRDGEWVAAQASPPTSLEFYIFQSCPPPPRWYDMKTISWVLTKWSDGHVFACSRDALKRQNPAVECDKSLIKNGLKRLFWSFHTSLQAHSLIGVSVWC